jgi:hypothetical protein
MTVSAPIAYAPGKYAVGGEGPAHYATVTVTIKIESVQQRNPTTAHLTASSGGQEGDQVYDGKVGANLDTTWSCPARLASGTWRSGRRASNDLTIEGSPGFAYNHTMWSS